MKKIGFVWLLIGACMLYPILSIASPFKFSGALISEPLLTEPDGLTFGPDGNLYISEFSNGEVRRFNPSTGELIDVFVSSGSGGLDGAVELTFGPDGNLYVASAFTDEVLRYNGTTGAFIDVFASGGGIDNPAGIVFGPDGNLYVTGFNSDNVLRYDGATGSFMDDFVSTGSGGLDQATALIFSGTDLLVTSFGTDSILRYDGGSGAFMDTFASGGGLDGPNYLITGPDLNLYVSSYGTDEVKRYSGIDGAFIDTVVTSGSGGLDAPQDMAFINGNFCVVAGDPGLLCYSVAEPSSIVLFGIGALGLLGHTLRRKKQVL